ncbi:MAG: rhamnose transport system ATP-binding protein [Gaiellales bacterium]|nr:rhamnose transport system ATP-binding protein [Gaiellales bacterium]
MPESVPSSAAAEAPLLVVDHASKSFGAVRALEDGWIELRRGEAHALVGENGAGKSTLVKILAGVHRPDGGRVLMDGVEVVFDTTAQSHAAGIAIIFQEPTLFPDLTVAENVFIGAQPLRSGRRIDRRRMRREVELLFEQLGVRLDPDRIARGLSIADQQIVEIAKALSADARVIVMDEPTAALTQTEVDRLFGVVETLRARGAAVLFISHRLDEVFALCQRVTVMRDGRHVVTEPAAETSTQKLIHAMVGRDLDALFPKQVAELGETVLSVRRLTREGVFTDVSFDVKAGEIVALAGLVGAGRSEVARAIFGIDRADAGSVEVHGRKLPPASPNAAMAAGIGFVPEDRRQQGLVMPISIERNMALASLDRLRRFLLIPRFAERRFASEWAARLQLRYGRLSDPASSLSGGNQQKIVLAKWLARRPALLIVDEPTRGIDVGTKAEVHRLLSDLANEGIAILMISSELPEVLGMADRVIVLFEGRVAGEFDRSEASELSIMQAAAGLAGEAAA